MKNVIGEQYQGNDPHAMIYMCNMQSLYIQRNVPKMGYSQPKEALLHLRIYYKMVWLIGFLQLKGEEKVFSTSPSGPQLCIPLTFLYAS